MYKINVQMPDYSTLEYFAAIVPIIGDTINIDFKFLEVVKRILPSDNPNFVIIHVK